MTKKYLLNILFMFTLAWVSQAETYVVDKSHSAVIFGIQHMGLGNTYGRFNDFSGTITFDDAKLKSSKIELEIKTASVDSYNKKRDDHLRNSDFFDAGTYSTMSFSSTSIEKVEGKKDAYKVSGELTLLSKSKTISFELVKVGSGMHFYAKKPAIGFEAQFAISRKDFSFGKGKAAGAVGDKVKIIVSLEAISK
jgi:polyisoprenoid-binding protein YceI